MCIYACVENVYMYIHVCMHISILWIYICVYEQLCVYMHVHINSVYVCSLFTCVCVYVFSSMEDEKSRMTKHEMLKQH